MTLIFSGNDFKYELEGVMKLFIPATLFKHIYGDSFKTDDDFVFARVKEFRKYTLLYVICKYNNKTSRKSQRTLNSLHTDRELCISRLLFDAMSEITGKVPKWGIITGVRPVKKVNSLLKLGKSKNEISDILKQEYLCSDEKCEIAYKTAITQQNLLKGLENRTFSLYVSIPFCPTRCSYCSFVSQSVEKCIKLVPEYIEKLRGEIEYVGKIVQKIGLKLDTVYFGGGTPTTLSAQQLETLMKVIEESFDMSFVREYTIEAGRPDTITREKLETIRKNGCSRISINPQTLNDSVLEAIGRKHTVSDFLDSYKIARSVGFDCINTDIIAGLPTDTYESFKKTVDGLLELTPENITVHTLSIKRASDINHCNEKDAVLKNRTDEMIEYATSKLSENGYNPYYLYRQKNMLENLENIGWAKTGKENLYNTYIMEEVQSIIAVGAGGSTKLVDLNNNRLERVFNYKYPLEYIRHYDLMLKRKNEIEEFYAK